LNEAVSKVDVRIDQPYTFASHGVDTAEPMNRGIRSPEGDGIYSWNQDPHIDGFAASAT